MGEDSGSSSAGEASSSGLEDLSSDDDRDGLAHRPQWADVEQLLKTVHAEDRYKMLKDASAAFEEMSQGAQLELKRLDRMEDILAKKEAERKEHEKKDSERKQ